MTSTRYTDMVR